MTGNPELASNDDAFDMSRRLSEISRAMVKIYREQFGRGPEHSSTRFSGPDVVVSLLGNSLTPVERSMLDLGEEERLRDIRLLFQHASEAQFRKAVEHATGRRVVAFMSGTDVHADISCEVFVLEPRRATSGAA